MPKSIIPEKRALAKKKCRAKWPFMAKLRDVRRPRYLSGETVFRADLYEEQHSSTVPPGSV